jgi:hypothetical protein
MDWFSSSNRVCMSLIHVTIFILKSTIWYITQFSPLKVNRGFGGSYRLHLQCWRISLASLPSAFTLASCSAYSSTPKMNTICSSETSIDCQRATRCYILEDITLRNYRCETLKSYVLILSREQLIVQQIKYETVESSCASSWLHVGGAEVKLHAL